MTDRKFCEKFDLKSNELIFTKYFTDVSFPLNLQFTIYIAESGSQFPVTITVTGSCESPNLLISFLGATTSFVPSVAEICTTLPVAIVPEGITVPLKISHVPILGLKHINNDNNNNNNNIQKDKNQRDCTPNSISNSNDLVGSSNLSIKLELESEKCNLVFCTKTKQVLTGTAVAAPLPSSVIASIAQSILQFIFNIPNATCLGLRQGDPEYPPGLIALAGILGIDPLSTIAESFAALLPLFIPIVSGEIARLSSLASLVPIQLTHLSGPNRIKNCIKEKQKPKIIGKCIKFINAFPVSIFVSGSELSRPVILSLNSTCPLFTNVNGSSVPTTFATTLRDYLTFLPVAARCQNNFNSLNNSFNKIGNCQVEIPSIGSISFISESPSQKFSPALLVLNELEIFTC